MVFAIITAILGLAGAFHSVGYLRGFAKGRLTVYWVFYLATIAAMEAVAFAAEPLLFLIAWELMGLASAVLVGFDYEEKAARDAAWMYLLACQAGGALLMLFFSLAGDGDSSLALSAAAITFALFGFGLKIGFPGLHIWLPVAHPVAPAPVSALMSGAMIPLGFCGLFRFVLKRLTPEQYPVMGWTLLALGVIGALYGIASALPQKNMKRLLACSSVENMGIVAIAMGLGLVRGATTWATLVASLHIFNHALLKGALFLGAGTVYRATGTLKLEAMGGLMKRMPRTGKLWTLAGIGISGLPPLCAFMSEFLIYGFAFSMIGTGKPMFVTAGIVAMLALAFTGGLATAVFGKAIGAAFLGEPRTAAAEVAVEASWWMVIPPYVLLALSFLIPICVLATLTAYCARPLIFLGVMVLLFGFYRLVLMRGKKVQTGPTWDCGYASPTARMAYTATAISQPLVDFLDWAIRPVRRLKRPFGLFPSAASSETSASDIALASLWRPLFTRSAALFERAHALQSGYLHLYVLAMTLTVLGLLVVAVYQ